MLQVPDRDASFPAVEAFRRELNRRAALFEAAQRYSHALMTLMMQSTACMAVHDVQQRCCRWLLMAHDRMKRDDFQLSHEFLAMMLASTRRPLQATPCLNCKPADSLPVESRSSLHACIAGITNAGFKRPPTKKPSTAFGPNMWRCQGCG